MKIATCLFGVTFIVWFCASCNRSGVSALSLLSSPSAVVQAAYMNCNSGRYSQVEPLFAADAQKLIHSEIGAANGGIKGLCDSNTRHGTITGLDVIREQIRGEGATVIVNIHFKDGSTKREDQSSLIRENGSWKIAK